MHHLPASLSLIAFQFGALLSLSDRELFLHPDNRLLALKGCYMRLDRTSNVVLKLLPEHLKEEIIAKEIPTEQITAKLKIGNLFFQNP